MDQFIKIIAALRHPETGCPWDLKQTHQSLAKYVIEEAYEVVNAIDTKDTENLKEELGDLLLQVVLHAQLASERGDFTFQDVVETIGTKIVRRHPHVFSDDTTIKTAEDQTAQWERVKAEEKKESPQESVFDPIPSSLPAHMRSQKLVKAVLSLDYCFTHADQVLALVRSECDEVEEALKANDKHHLQEELGDVIFTAINLTNFLGFDVDETLRNTNRKIEKRYRRVEEVLKADPRPTRDIPFQELVHIWKQVKKDVP